MHHITYIHVDVHVHTCVYIILATINCSCSSIQLLGDLLYKVSGLSGKMSTESEEDDNFGTEEARSAIIRCLGEERRNRVLAGLYMGR